ncbi:RluA family pseudouridine synthase [Pelagibacterales bacterium SAG-MED15]|nr:RluA family pseudouridine synthase [Pelagibacterales bacterium SAG-MED15]
MKNNINIIIADNATKERVDQFLSKKFQNLSRNRIKNLIINKNLKINNITIFDPSKKIIVGDNLILKIPIPKKSILKPYNFKIDIVFQDKDLMIINKPAGISMHPGAGDYDKTLVNALIYYDKKNLSNIGDELRPGIVHRIDKDTSGLIVIAKNNVTHEKLSKQFSDHSVKRIYQALIWGKLRPQNGRIKTMITRSSKNRQLMEVGVTKGKSAITNYKTLKIYENETIPTFSLVECKLETGRTHQIRVHMSYKGNHILGDKKYKKKFKRLKNINKNLSEEITNLKRQFLHAKTLGFVHPVTGKVLEFSSNLPKDLDNIVKILKNAC